MISMPNKTRSADPTNAIGEMVEGLIASIFKAVWWIVRRPSYLLPVLTVGIAAYSGGAEGAAIAAFSLVILLVILRLLAPHTFRRWISAPRARAHLKRRYKKHWARVTQMCELSKGYDGGRIVPALAKIEVDGPTHHLTVRMVTGQHRGHWDTACPQLAAAFGARLAHVRAVQPGTIRLDLMFGDTLATPVERTGMGASADLRLVPVGLREDGQAWALPFLGSHLFIGGVTGAGKSSVVWSLLFGLQDAIGNGTVAVWAIDPKGGMELGIGAPLFDRFGYESTAQMVELLEEAVTVMDARCRSLAGLARLHTPSTSAPLLLVLVDELSTLTAYEPDSKLRTRAIAALSALLARGRAAAVVVVACAQDPRKEVVSFRSLFPTRVALRLDTPSQVDMVLGDGMHSMGAAADQIGATEAGVGYVASDGDREPVRVRSSYVSDDEIRCLVDRYQSSTGVKENRT